MSKIRRKGSSIFNDSMRRELNKYFGFPEKYTGEISTFKDVMPDMKNIFKIDKITEL